jgi:hypothetical protein
MIYACPITGYRSLHRQGTAVVFANEFGIVSHMVPECNLERLSVGSIPYSLETRLYEAKDEMTGNVIPYLDYSEGYGFEWVPQPYAR